MARIGLIEEQDAVDPTVRAAFDRMRVKRGKVTNIYKALAHSPAILSAMGPFVAAVQQPDQLDARLKERIILRVSILNQSAYCTHAHQQISARMGFTEREIHDMHDPVGAPLSREELAALAYAEEMTLRPGQVSDAAFEEVRACFSEPQIVELTMLVALYNMVNRFNEALRLDPEDY